MTTLRALNRLAYPGEHVRVHAVITAEILEGQHPIRAWEYSQALYALQTWDVDYVPDVARIADVGGAGSQFYRTLRARHATASIDVVDPDLATPDGQRGIVHGLLPGATAVKFTLAEWSGYAQNVAAYDAVFCLSVIEHVEDPQAFVQQLCSLVRPGGLLVLTCDAGETAVDTYHFHWMRRWIPDSLALERLQVALYAQGFRRLGAPPDFTYQGPTVFDYAVASIAVVREGL